ncbi:single-stranded DNA-binding protein [Agrococcus sediminis]|jgi:single-strand DNA-binding protein|uniref:single-stranded DNA-binding protein n=1 Tax=Agrococcus sediminis TaxID=2599924 RepID=UPI0034265596
MNDAITVVGSLGGDPIVKTVNGDRVAEFRLASTSRRKEDEQWVDAHTNWFSVEAWGGFAEHVGSSLRKGDLVVVLGKLKVDQWESGDKRGTSVKIRAEHVGHSLRVGPVSRERRQPQPDAEHREPAPADREAQAPEPALVGAGADQWHAPGADADPPF